ncbi:Alpha/beta hydrolase family-domain-containing protein, partial [Vararia minispora EC-137]
ALGLVPPLPSPRRAPDFSHGFTLSTHLVPAAYPRTTAYFSSFPPAPENETKEERQIRVRKLELELWDLRRRYEKGELDEMEKNENVLWMCFNRYVRRSAERDGKQTGLTLFCAHANGMHKETFEPMLHRLLALSEKDDSYRIDEIWTFDAVQHGDSALVNGNRSGPLYDWMDNTRDMLNFLLHYLPETVSSMPLPIHLEELPARVVAKRRKEGFSARHLVAVGHSFGGCTLVLGAYHMPEIFSGLALIDPVILPAPPSMDRSTALRNYVANSFARRSSWPSRDEAYMLLKKSPFFRSWDDNVLSHYVLYAMTPTLNGQVRLKCSGYDEAYVFADRLASWEAFTVLPAVDSRIPIKWIVCPARLSVAEREDVQQARVWRRPVNTTSVVLSDGGHLV